MNPANRRIKEEIEDVPDNKALEMVRNIPCRYYKYKDVTKKRYDSSNNEIKTIRHGSAIGVILPRPFIVKSPEKPESKASETTTAINRTINLI